MQTISIAFMSSPVVLYYDLLSIFISLGITVLLVLLVAVLSACTSFDFTRYLCVVNLIVLGFILGSGVMMIVSAFTGAPPNWLIMVKAGVGVAVFMLVMIEKFMF